MKKGNKMYRLFKNIILIGITALLAACGSGGTDNTTTTSQTENKADKYTGLSRDAVDAQLAVKIRSPYQLVQSFTGYVQSIDREDYTSKDKYSTALKDALMDATLDIMPKASANTQEEIANFLLKHYIKHGTH